MITANQVPDHATIARFRVRPSNPGELEPARVVRYADGIGDVGVRTGIEAILAAPHPARGKLVALYGDVAAGYGEDRELAWFVLMESMKRAFDISEEVMASLAGLAHEPHSRASSDWLWTSWSGRVGRRCCSIRATTSDGSQPR